MTMKIPHFLLGSASCGGLLLVLLAGLGVARVLAAEPAAPNELGFEVPKSVFNYDEKVARDPFFPNSTRLKPVPPPPVVQPRTTPETSQPRQAPVPVAAPVVESLYSQLSLRGIIGNKQFAQINSQTFAQGEQLGVRLSKGLVRVKCVEIRERSVVVQIEGEPQPKELFLRTSP